MVKDIGGNRTDLRKRIDDLREALIEIRDIAHVSEAAEFYAMIARHALEEDDRHITTNQQAEILPFEKIQGDEPYEVT